MTNTQTGALLLAALLLTDSTLCQAGRGDIDPGYGSGGQVGVDAPFGPAGLVGLTDGTLLSVAPADAAYNGTLLVHWDVDGHPDAGFGTAGISSITLPFQWTYGGAARTSKNKYYVWGAQPVFRNNLHTHDMAVLRLDAAGHLDPTFAAAGVLSRPAAAFAPYDDGFGDEVEGLALQPDGRMLVADTRYSDFYDLPLSVTIRRFQADGSDDLSFGAGTGSSLLPAGAWGNWVSEPLTVLSSGLIRIADSTTVFLNADGSPGTVSVSYQGLRPDVSVWRFAGAVANGDTLIEGETTGLGVAIALVHSDGTLATDFGAAGTGFVEFAGCNLLNSYLAGDGLHLYVVMACHTQPLGYSLARLNLVGSFAGRLDDGFGVHGMTLLPPGGVTGIIEQSGGAVLVTTGVNRAFRLLGADSPSPGFIGVSSFPTGPSGPNVAPATIYLTLARAAGKDGAISLHYSTSDIDAIAGVNYQATSGTLDWADGESGEKSIAFQLLDAPFTNASGYKTFNVQFDTPTGGTFPLESTVQLAILGAVTPVPPPPPVVTPGAAAASGGGGSTDARTLALLLLAAACTMRRRWPCRGVSGSGAPP